MHVKSNLDFIQIGLRVRGIRKAAHLKPGEFGEKIGVGDRHISNVESSARHLSPELAANICDAFPQYTGHHQIPLLGDDGREFESHIRLPEL